MYICMCMCISACDVCGEVGRIRNGFLLLFVCIVVVPGPNNLSLFQPKYPDTEGLINKLVLFFHPKVGKLPSALGAIFDACMVSSPQACKDNICVDLSPSHAVEGALEGTLVGEVYVTRDVQAS